MEVLEVFVDLRLRLARGDVLEGEGGHRGAFRGSAAAMGVELSGRFGRLLPRSS